MESPTKIDSTSTEHLEFGKILMRLSERGIIPNPLQDLAQGQVGQPQALPGQFSIQPRSVRTGNAPQIVNPNRRIHDHHVSEPLERVPSGIPLSPLPNAPCRVAGESHSVSMS